jgi:hypothetical protein
VCGFENLRQVNDLPLDDVEPLFWGKRRTSGSGEDVSDDSLRVDRETLELVEGLFDIRRQSGNGVDSFFVPGKFGGVKSTLRALGGSLILIRRLGTISLPPDPTFVLLILPS